MQALNTSRFARASGPGSIVRALDWRPLVLRLAHG